MPQHSAFIVDDSKSARVMLSRMLSKSGYSVSEFESGDDFLSRKEELNVPNLIFMDHMMPGVDGLTATRSLKQDGNYKDVPVIMYTSQDDKDYLGELKKAGATGILHKPAKLAELNEILGNSSTITHTHSPQESADALLLDTIKTVKRLEAEITQLGNENKHLRGALDAKSESSKEKSHDIESHGTHVTQDAHAAALRQLSKQYDEKLHSLEQRLSNRLTSIKLSDHEKRNLESQVSQSARKTAERTAEKVATSQAQAISAKVAAAQSDLITRDALSSINAIMKVPKLIAAICILLTLFSIGLHFSG